MTELTVGIKGIGLAAPGLPNWPDSQSVLRGEATYLPEDMQRYAPNLLPPNERRRATAAGRLAFQSAEEAINSTNGAACELASVFASSSGDSDIVTKICTTLATEQRQVSPTLFHNSVHNAPAGYWSIATHSHAASSSVSAFDGSFAAGLIEAATLALCEDIDVLLVAYDAAITPPMVEKRPIKQPFTSAYILSPKITAVMGRLKVGFTENSTETTLEDNGLESLRKSNPAARALPLLRALAMGDSSPIILPSAESLFVSVNLEG